MSGRDGQAMNEGCSNDISALKEEIGGRVSDSESRTEKESDRAEEQPRQPGDVINFNFLAVLKPMPGHRTPKTIFYLQIRRLQLHSPRFCIKLL